MYEDMGEVNKAVEDNQNVLTLEMSNLRDAYGKKRLGKFVLDGIKDELIGMGLGHYPSELPNDQRESVRIYKLGSGVGKIIDAVLKVGEDSDEFLRKNSANDDADLLKQVREIVCPD